MVLVVAVCYIGHPKNWLIDWLIDWVCLHLYIPWKFGERGLLPAELRGRVCLFVCFFCSSCYDARHRKPRRCVYALNLGGTGISPPDKSPPGKRPPGQKHPPAKNPSGQKTPREKVPPGKQAVTYSIAAVAGHWTILVAWMYLVVFGMQIQSMCWLTTRQNNVVVLYVSAARAMPAHHIITPATSDVVLLSISTGNHVNIAYLYVSK